MSDSENITPTNNGGAYNNQSFLETSPQKDSASHDPSEYESYYSSEKEEDFCIQSEYLQSDGFTYMESAADAEIRKRHELRLNSHLLGYQREIYLGILYDDGDKIEVAGVKDVKNINFKLEVSKGNFYTPLMFAAVKGSNECMKVLVDNMSIELDIVDRKTGCNAFWLAAYYGRGRCLSILGAAGSDIIMKHKITSANALHIALIRGHFEIVK